MNTAIDISAMPVVADYLDPDWQAAESLRDEAREAAREDYIDDWSRGEVYDDGEVYSRPVELLQESHGELLGQLLSVYRHGDHAELESVAGTLARALEGHVKNQAEVE